MKARQGQLIQFMDDWEGPCEVGEFCLQNPSVGEFFSHESNFFKTISPWVNFFKHESNLFTILFLETLETQPGVNDYVFGLLSLRSVHR